MDLSYHANLAEIIGTATIVVSLIYLALKLREYLMRGGFLLCDSFYGTVEWEGFVRGMFRIFPDRPSSSCPTHTRSFIRSTI